MVAHISKVRSAEMIIQYNLARPFRAVTLENFGSVTLKFFPAFIQPVSRQISGTICRTSTSRSINNAFGIQTVQHATLRTFIDIEMRQYMLLMYNSIKDRLIGSGKCFQV